MRTRIRTVARWSALGALALALAGCVRVDMELEVAADNTVSGSAILAVDDSLLELTDQTPDQLFQDMETTTDLPEGASVEPYEEDGYVGQRITFEGVSLKEFSRGGVAASGEQLSIRRDGDEFHVNGRLDMRGSEFGGSDVPQQFLESIEFRIAITFPGRVSSATGEIDGNTVTWTPQVGRNTEIRAVASAIPSGSPLLPVVLIAIVLVIAIVAFVVVWRRRTPPTATATAGTWPEPPSGAIPPSASTTTGFAEPAPPPPPTDTHAAAAARETDDTSSIDPSSTEATDTRERREDAREDGTMPPSPPSAPD